tara:strand:- start:409 stop:1059 length:651 start_codon:yes stop_codon:yes gene_type:complete
MRFKSLEDVLEVLLWDGELDSKDMESLRIPEKYKEIFLNNFYETQPDTKKDIFKVRREELIQFAPDAETEIRRTSIDEINDVSITDDRIYVANNESVYCFDKNLTIISNVPTKNTPIQLAISGNNVYYLDSANDLHKIDDFDHIKSFKAYKPFMIQADDENKGVLFLAEKVNDEYIRFTKLNPNGTEAWSQETKVPKKESTQNKTYIRPIEQRKIA